LNVELGYKKDVSTITMVVGRGSQTIKAMPPAQYIMGAIAHAVAGSAISSFAVTYPQLLVLSPTPAHYLAEAGWSKKAIKDFVYEKARIPLAEAEAAGMSAGSEGWRTRLIGADKSTLVPISDRPEALQIIVAGSSGSDNSSIIHGTETIITKEVDKYKPANWQQLIKTAKEELRY